MPNTVLILGASGKIGQNAARAFTNAGWNVRNHDRKSDDMTAAAHGVDCIVNGLNPPNYHNWAKTIPGITKRVVAAAKRTELACFEDIPFPGHSFTVLELQDALQDHLGRSIKITGFPWWMFTVLAPVWELAREMNEMRYLWNTPHQLSGGKFNRLLPDFVPTDMRRVMFASLPDDIHPNKTVPGRSRITAS